ncbi:hypothetical protein F442_15312 [Phytophthora nicotianae P10297]|uniref:Sugar transporter SWEET1 n=1 Tax=Phytophthora nicotianae P10297 TaxID=1317064 RepID=W2YP68_PHYNI|nr:hypothetical protein F442_15312 [Phytophthora nicotianae P10297]
MSILHVLSTAAAILAVLAPFPDFWRIYKTRSTGSVSVLPVVLIFCNCYAWVMYARQVNSIPPLFVAYAVGMLASIAFVLGRVNQSSEQVENTLGAVSGLINLALYASPLERIKHVIQTKDASTIPITISAFLLVNGVVWVLHSIVEDDMLVLIPNALGVALCIVQVGLYVVYYPRKAAPDTLTNTASFPV